MISTQFNWHLKPLTGIQCNLNGEFDQLNLTDQIGCKSIEITLYACLVESVELGVNPLRLHCTLPVKGFRCQTNSTGQIGCKSIQITLPVKGFRCRTNSTGRIGCKSIEITLYACLVKSVELGVNPL